MVDREDSVVISTFAELCLMVNGGSFNLYFAGREVTLEVRGIVFCIPETELNEAEEIEILIRIRCIRKSDTVNFAVIIDRNKRFLLCCYAILR